MEEETWALILGFPRYRVSNYGRVWNDFFNMQMRPSKMGPQRSWKISLIDHEGNRQSLVLVSLVAQAFVEPPNEKSTVVIQLDGDMDNVAAKNLVWRTPRQAWLYARQMRTPPHTFWETLRIRNVNTGVEYESITHCGIVEGLIFQEISDSVTAAMCRPPYKLGVYPHGHTYEMGSRVQGRR